MDQRRFLSTLTVLLAAMLGTGVCQNSDSFGSFGIKRFAFETGPGSFSSPHEDIFVLDSLKSKPRRLATGTNAVWSPDGQRLAYCEHEGWGTPHIVLGQMQLIDADGSDHRQLTKLPGGACPVGWSRDGQKIAFGSAQSGILFLDKDGNVTNISPGSVGLWSPDGSKLAFWKYRESRNSSGSIWVANADGSNPRKVIDDNSEIEDLTWGPDGETLLFASEREHKGKSKIFRVKLDGSNLETVAEDKKLSFFSPVISPDNKSLVVGAFPSGSGDSTILLLDLTTHTRTVLAHGTHPHIVWDKP